MSARKLQQEFDKTNKKIAEGLTAFDDIYDKLMTTEISSQKEKLESDLKKEIKKLQRLRDQLKTWLGDSSIKLDKNLLQENRTKIERAMDQFKDLEKSSKIKQFLNEGLELQSQKSRFGRPEDRKKEEASNYICDIIDQLNQQNEALEVEIHLLLVQLKKAKSSNVASLQSSIDDERYKVDRNVTHLTKLEKILRNLENDNLEPELIDEIKDDLEYYVENNQEEDYVEYDDFYDMLELSDDIVDDVQGSLVTLAVSSQAEKEDSSITTPVPAVEEKKQVVNVGSSKLSTPKVSIAPLNKKTSSTISIVTNGAGANLSSNNTSAQTGSGNVGWGPSSLTNSSLAGTPVKKGAKAFVASVQNPPPIASYTNIIKNATAEKQQPLQASTPTSTKAPPPGFRTESSPGSSTPIAQTSRSSPTTTQSPEISKVESTDVLEDSEIMSNEGKTFMETIPRLSTIPQSRLNNPLPFQSINQLLESSLLNCPDSFDAEKPRQYHPVNTHPSSVDFPQEPMYELNSSNMMKKFDNDTLFFCFYYSVGVDSLAKWNAAQELSRRGWIFNSDLKQWFSKDHSRNQSVTGIREDTNDSNSENYKYFDYEKTWLTRRRENYKFSPELRETF